MEKASQAGRRKLVRKQLDRLVKLSEKEPESMLQIARRMIRRKFPKEALKLLERAGKQKPGPDLQVQIEMAAATAEVKMGRRKAAGERLDRLLERLTPDYWRREEVWQRRISLIENEQERKKLVRRLRKKISNNPKKEAPVLDLARLLEAMERRRDALNVLMDASDRLPDSQPIEKRTLKLLNRLMAEQELASFLKQRLEESSDRTDLLYRYVQTLFQLGKSKRAKKKLDKLEERLSGGERNEQLLRLARSLRESALLEYAAEVYERLCQYRPDSLKLRRELAEIYLSLGRRQDARDLMKEPASDDTPVEDLLDTARFLVSEKLYREARTHLRSALDQHETNLKLRLILMSVENKLGNTRRAMKLQKQARKRADTPPRYRRWLQESVEFRSSLEDLDVFFQNERSRLYSERPGSSGENENGDRATPERHFQKVMILADVAGKSDHRGTAVEVLRDTLTWVQQSKRKSLVRRRLIRHLQKQDGDHREAITKQLNALAKAAPEASDEISLRRALLKEQSGKKREAISMVSTADFQTVEDPELLEEVFDTFKSNLDVTTKLNLLERLTSVDPSNVDHWETWSNLLARNGREARLRFVIKKLLGGVEDVELDEDVREHLRGHLVDSYWRSITNRIQGGTDAEYADALALLDQLERQAGQPEEPRLWTYWTRAFLLNRLERSEERDEAISELNRLVEKQSGSRETKKNEEKKKEKKKNNGWGDSETMIAFPGGVRVSLEYAKRVLKGKTKEPEGLQETGGPEPPLSTRWSFETEKLRAITEITPVTGPSDDGSSGPSLAVTDVKGRIYVVQRETGKLIWSHPGYVQSTENDSISFTTVSLRTGGQTRTNRGSFLGGAFRRRGRSRRRRSRSRDQEPLLPRPATDSTGKRIYFPGRDSVNCYSSATGELLWRADVTGPDSGSASATGPTPVYVETYEELVIGYAPASATVSAFHQKSGKLQWSRSLSSGNGNQMSVNSRNSGISLDGRDLFVYGPVAVLLELPSGTPRVRFTPSSVRELPIELSTSTPGPAGSGSVSGPNPSQRRKFRMVISRLKRLMQRGRISRQKYQQSVRIYRRRYGVSSSYMKSGLQSGSSDEKTSFGDPAISWLKSLRKGKNGLGFLVDNRLLLRVGGSSDVLSRRMDLPFRIGHRRLEVGEGRVIGVADRRVDERNRTHAKLCVLSKSAVHISSLDGQRQKTIPLPDKFAGGSLRAYQAAVDGAKLYVSTLKGLLVLNTRTGDWIARENWPEMTPVPAEKLLKRMPSGFPGDTGSRGKKSSIERPLPPSARVIEGTLYTLPAPWRVVAIGTDREEQDNGSGGGE